MASLMQRNKMLVFTLSLALGMVLTLGYASAQEESALTASSDLKTLLTSAEALIRENKTDNAFEVYTRIMTNSDLLEKVDFPKFHYNLAVTAAKTKKIGLAIAYLYKTIADSPFDWDARHNLKILKSEASNHSRYGQQYYSINFLRPVLEYTPPGTFLLLSSLALLIILLNALIFRHRMALVLSLLIFIPTTSIATYTAIEKYNDAGVVIADTPPLRSGPGDSFPEILQIGEGSEVSLLEKRKEWFKVEFSLATNPDEAIVGWLHEEDVLSL